MLSFGMPGRRRSTVPSASTASKPPVCRPHRSVAEDVDAAGVRRDHPADRRRVPRAEVDAEPPNRRPAPPTAPRRASCRRRRSSRRPSGSTSSMPSRRRRLTTTSPAARHRPADKPGVAALGHDADAGIGACAEHASDLVGRRRAHDRERGPGPAARPIGLVRGPQVGIGQAVARPDDLGELRNERRRVHSLMLPARHVLARRAWTNVTSGCPCRPRTRATSPRTRRRA